jgi:hypothetical protein
MLVKDLTRSPGSAPGWGVWPCGPVPPAWPASSCLAVWQLRFVLCGWLVFDKPQIKCSSLNLQSTSQVKLTTLGHSNFPLFFPLDLLLCIPSLTLGFLHYYVITENLRPYTRIVYLWFYTMLFFRGHGIGGG